MSLKYDTKIKLHKKGWKVDELGQKTNIYENKNIERGAMIETKSSAKTWTGGHTFI